MSRGKNIFGKRQFFFFFKWRFPTSDAGLVDKTKVCVSTREDIISVFCGPKLTTKKSNLDLGIIIDFVEIPSKILITSLYYAVLFPKVDFKKPIRIDL